VKKIGLICLALILALGALGIGYAMWEETLTIDGVVYTGNVDVEFSQYSNDPPPHGTCAGGIYADPLDPKVCGSWTIPGVNGLEPWEYWSGDRWDKNVASTNCTLDVNSLSIEIDNGYPSYWGSVLFDIDNVGTIPVAVISCNLTDVSGYTIPGGMELDAGERYYVDVDTATPTVHTGTVAAGDDFSFMIDEYNDDFTQIDPGDVGYGWICIHVEQDAAQNNTTDYTFTIEIVVCNWNEPGI